MNEAFQCGDNTALVGYLYGECEAAERQAIESHIGMCAACAAELAALESTRLQLSSWAPPEAELGFQVVRAEESGPGRLEGSAAGLRPLSAERHAPWYTQPLPAWAQAAAAVVIFAAGLAMGVARGAAPAPDQAILVAPAPADAAVSPAELAALEERLQAEIAQIRSADAEPAEASRISGEAQLLARVQTLIEQSEQRQQRELALRTAQIVRDFDSQRRVDLAQIRRTFGEIEGLTGAEVREQRQMLNYLIRASQQR